ncbi:MAG: alpha/beta fold hydrolase [Bradymonadaceae bacterium]
MRDIRHWPITRYLVEGPAHTPLSTGRLSSHWVDVEGRQFHTRVSDPAEAAEDRDVVLVHGLGVSSLYMVPTARLLAGQERVWAPDLPGFGHSDNPDEVLDIEGLADALAAWMRTVGLRESAVVGNSMGTQTAVTCALRHPALIDRLVLQGPTIDPEARNYFGLMLRWLRDMAHEPPSETLILLRDGVQCGPIRFLGTWRHALEDRIEEKLPQVHQPTMVVRGMQDRLVPERWVRQVIDLLPDGRLRQIPGAAHTLNFATPLEFVRVMAPFLFESTAV